MLIARYFMPRVGSGLSHCLAVHFHRFFGGAHCSRVFDSALERLLHSSWKSVLVSAAIFGLLHWYRGAILIWNAFLIGLIYGTAFVWTRRLWPIVMAQRALRFVGAYVLGPLIYRGGTEADWPDMGGSRAVSKQALGGQPRNRIPQRGRTGS